MDLHLVSFKTCPYVQRSVITLKRKNVPYEITYIDLANPPAWFKADSPLGKVPILKVTRGGNTTVLFESAVINEFVDEVSGGGGLPDDAVDRARDRAWIQFVGECLMDYFQAAMAPDEESHRAKLADLKGKLGRLDAEVKGSFWNGDEFGLVDSATAPLLMRLAEFADLTDFDLTDFPALESWRVALEALPEVAESMVPEWRQLQREFIGANSGYLGPVATANA